MADVSRLVNPDADPVLLEGEVADTAVAVGDLVRVKLPALSETHTTVPLAFPPRADGRLPREHDGALVAIAQDTGHEWLIAWTPNG